jgi:hypothetical protein
MTLGALQVLVFSSQPEMRTRMIKRFDRLPVSRIVTRLTLGAQLSGMMIFVASEAGRVQTLEGLRQVVNHDVFTVGRGNVFGIMAVLALQLRMLAEQRVTGLLMVELFLGCLPFEDAKPLAVMLGMTAGAIRVVLGVVGDPPMHTLVVLYQFGDFPVAVEALELGFPGAKAMTHGTL